MTTNQVGSVAQAKILARFTQLGKQVLIPFSNIGRYDLVIEEKGKFLRVECKNGRYRNGAVLFNTASFGGYNNDKTKKYDGDADLFAVWCERTDRVYAVLVSQTPICGKMSLRVEPADPSSNQDNIRWAKDFEL